MTFVSSLSRVPLDTSFLSLPTESVLNISRLLNSCSCKTFWLKFHLQSKLKAQLVQQTGKLLHTLSLGKPSWKWPRVQKEEAANTCCLVWNMKINNKWSYFILIYLIYLKTNWRLKEKVFVTTIKCRENSFLCFGWFLI